MTNVTFLIAIVTWTYLQHTLLFWRHKDGAGPLQIHTKPPLCAAKFICRVRRSSIVLWMTRHGLFPFVDCVVLCALLNIRDQASVVSVSTGNSSHTPRTSVSCSSSKVPVKTNIFIIGKHKWRGFRPELQKGKKDKPTKKAKRLGVEIFSHRQMIDMYSTSHQFIEFY